MRRLTFAYNRCRDTRDIRTFVAGDHSLRCRGRIVRYTDDTSSACNDDPLGGAYPLNAVAQGDAYILGLNGEPSYGDALRCYMVGADAGEPRAMMRLGYLNSHGLGASEDPGQAYVWYLKTANTGDLQGMNNLGCS